MSNINLAVGQYLNVQRGKLSQAITDRHFQAHPELDERYGPIGRVRCLEDNNFHLSYLAEAIAADSPILFADYIAWAKVMLAGRNIPAEDLASNLNYIRETFDVELPAEMRALIVNYLDAGLAELPQYPMEVPTFIRDEEPLAELAQLYLNALLRGERQLASSLILDAVASGTDIRDIYIHVFQRSQYEIGRLWQINEVSVAQEHYCTAATQLIMSQLYSHIFSTARNGHILVAACVAEDLHEIGVRMISDFFEMEGWDTFYLGANTPTTSIIETAITRGADMLAISATITSHVRVVSRLISMVRDNSDLRDIKILVGGYPFRLANNLWHQVGADATADNAVDAVAVANRLVGG